MIRRLYKRNKCRLWNMQMISNLFLWVTIIGPTPIRPLIWRFCAFSAHHGTRSCGDTASRPSSGPCTPCRRGSHPGSASCTRRSPGATCWGLPASFLVVCRTPPDPMQSSLWVPKIAFRRNFLVDHWCSTSQCQISNRDLWGSRQIQCQQDCD